MSVKSEALSQLNIAVDVLNENNFSSLEIIEKDYHYESTIQYGTDKFKLLFYFGKKGVKKVIQGNSSLPAYKEIEELISGEMKLGLASGVSGKDIGGVSGGRAGTLSGGNPLPPVFVEPESYIGTDESGKGDFFGPLVSAAFYVDSLKSQARLRLLGVKDSKMLSDKQIRGIAVYLRTEFEGCYNIISINPARYNEMYPKIMNINKILNWQHSKAIEGLLEVTKCKTVITDKFSKRELNISLKSDNSDIDFIMLTKAERFVGVAAASILARDTFNLWFEREAREGRKLPKGNAAIVEEAANKIIDDLGKDALNNFVKLHFKTTLKLK
ncbi:MAG: ribonuclease HIII [Melioribacteraceae bacterium]|nr:ribonuclease HIII [Melioribacteraceae bacterium]